MSKLRRIPPQETGWINLRAKYAKVIPRRDRRQRLLLRASKGAFQVDGGRGPGTAGDKELVRLIDAGLLRLKRVDVGQGWGGKYRLRRTRVQITEAGWAALFAGETGIAKPLAKSRRRPEKRGRHV